MLVVVSAPSDNQDTSQRQARKPMVVQALIPESAVKTLERILRRLASLDQLELHAVLVGPLVQRPACELRSLVSPDRLWIRAVGKEGKPLASRLLAFLKSDRQRLASSVA